MVDKIKSIVEFIGLIPTLLGFFEVTPQWFKPSEFYEPDILYWAGLASLLTFCGSYVYFLRVHGPVTAWTSAGKRSHFIEAGAGLAAAALLMVAYILVVRLLPNASVAVDLVQQVSWAGFFACLTFGITGLACIWKAP